MPRPFRLRGPALRRVHPGRRAARRPPSAGVTALEVRTNSADAVVFVDGRWAAPGSDNSYRFQYT